MPNDLWTPPTNWNTGTNFTEAKAEQEITDDMYVLFLMLTGDTSVALTHRHRSGTLGARPAFGNAGRLYYATDDTSLWLDNGASWVRISTGMLLDSGVYTPTLTNSNCTSTAYQCQWMRIGAMVNVSGKFEVDPTTGGVLTSVGISLPIASNIGAVSDVGGAASWVFVTASPSSAGIRGNIAGDRAEAVWIAGDVNNQEVYFVFQYRII